MEIKPGTLLGGYRVLSHLTKGGMGSLYVARKDGPGGFARDVVLKVVHRELSLDDEFVRLFLQEARLSVAIRHPNVVHVEDLGQEGNTYFIVMELFEGVSLSRVLKRMRAAEQPFPTAIAVYIARCLADGMHAAHETTDRQGHPLDIVHRDATPHNVLVGRNGQVKLIDFGIAKARTATVYTQKGMVRGKIAYLAPEQVWGKAVDRRTDIYALGAVIYEMLAGRRLVEANNQAELFAIVREPDHAPVRTFRPEIPADLDRAVMRALAPSPDQRYATAREMRDALMDAYPAALRTGAENLAPVVQQMAAKELAAIQGVIRSSREAVPHQGSPSSSPARKDMAPPAALDMPAIPAPMIQDHALGMSDSDGTDASLRAAGIDPRSGSVLNGAPAKALAAGTMPIPLVPPAPPPGTEARRRVDSVSGAHQIRQRAETGSGTVPTDEAPGHRFSMEVENEERARIRSRRETRQRTKRRMLIVLALLTPLVGAAMVVGALAVMGFIQ
ncbi:MAG: protein kinase [Deltaproteobacteria bacterium]|nr:protein kinase [Deltaproteobacteria bacterium]